MGNTFFSGNINIEPPTPVNKVYEFNMLKTNSKLMLTGSVVPNTTNTFVLAGTDPDGTRTPLGPSLTLTNFPEGVKSITLKGEVHLKGQAAEQIVQFPDTVLTPESNTIPNLNLLATNYVAYLYLVKVEFEYE